MLKWYFALLYRVRDCKNGLFFFSFVHLVPKTMAFYSEEGILLSTFANAWRFPPAHQHRSISTCPSSATNTRSPTAHTHTCWSVCALSYLNVLPTLPKLDHVTECTRRRNKTNDKKAKQLFVYTFSSLGFVGFIFIFALLLFCIFLPVAMNNAARTVPSTSASAAIIPLSSWIWRVECERAVVHIWFRFTTHTQTVLSVNIVMVHAMRARLSPFASRMNYKIWWQNTHIRPNV